MPNKKPSPSKKKSPRAKAQPQSARVMLLLPAPLASALDAYADRLSTPFKRVNRQNAIRSVLEEIAQDMMTGGNLTVRRS